MSDTFWVVLGGIVTIVVKDLLDQWRNNRIKSAVDEGKMAVQNNTDVTISKADVLYQKVESATKEVNEQATAAAQIATKAVTQNVLVSHRLIEQTKDLSTKTEIISDRLNGGPGGLQELSIRVAKIEGQMDGVVKAQDVFAKGQVEMVKAMDHFSEVLERKMV